MRHGTPKFASLGQIKKSLKGEVFSALDESKIAAVLRSHDLPVPGKTRHRQNPYTDTLFTAGCKVEPLGSLRCIGVSTTPGATALKRMPSFAYSIARFWVTEFKVPFVIIETVPFTAIGRSASAAAKLTSRFKQLGVREHRESCDVLQRQPFGNVMARLGHSPSEE